MGIHRWSVNSPHKGPVTRKMFPFHHVIMDLAAVDVSFKEISTKIDNGNRICYLVDSNLDSSKVDHPLSIVFSIYIGRVLQKGYQSRMRAIYLIHIIIASTSIKRKTQFLNVIYPIAFPFTMYIKLYFSFEKIVPCFKWKTMSLYDRAVNCDSMTMFNLFILS